MKPTRLSRILFDALSGVHLFLDFCESEGMLAEADGELRRPRRERGHSLIFLFFFMFSDLFFALFLYFCL